MLDSFILSIFCLLLYTQRHCLAISVDSNYSTYSASTFSYSLIFLRCNRTPTPSLSLLYYTPNRFIRSISPLPSLNSRIAFSLRYFTPPPTPLALITPFTFSISIPLFYTPYSLYLLYIHQLLHVLRLSLSLSSSPGLSQRVSFIHPPRLLYFRYSCTPSSQPPLSTTSFRPSNPERSSVSVASQRAACTSTKKKKTTKTKNTKKRYRVALVRAARAKFATAAILRKCTRQPKAEPPPVVLSLSLFPRVRMSSHPLPLFSSSSPPPPPSRDAAAATAAEALARAADATRDAVSPRSIFLPDALPLHAPLLGQRQGSGDGSPLSMSRFDTARTKAPLGSGFLAGSTGFVDEKFEGALGGLWMANGRLLGFQLGGSWDQ